QRRRAHQKFINGACTLAPLADGPYDERLATPHIAGSEHLVDTGTVAGRALGRGTRIAARVLFNTEPFENGCHRRDESHREQDQVGGNLELRTGYLDHPRLARVRIFFPLDADALERSHLSLAVVLERLRVYCPYASHYLFVACRTTLLDRP